MVHSPANVGDNTELNKSVEKADTFAVDVHLLRCLVVKEVVEHPKEFGGVRATVYSPLCHV